MRAERSSLLTARIPFESRVSPLLAADFASTTSDRDVLKLIMRTLTPTQASTMARMPRERVLNTVAAHRDSHRLAHEALARLGKVLGKFAKAPLASVMAGGSAGAGAGAGAGAAAAAKDGGARKVEVRAEGSVSEEDGEAAPLEGTGTGEETGEEEEEEEEGADAGLPLGERLLSGLNETLSLFAVPLEMTDDEVVHELLAGTSTEQLMPTAHRLHLKALTLQTREAILERFIQSSLTDLKALFLAIPPPPPPPEPAPAGGADGEGGDKGGDAAAAAATPAGPRLWRLNSSEHAEALELAVDLLLHHEVEQTNTDEKNVADLFELLALTPGDELPGGGGGGSGGGAGGEAAAAGSKEAAAAAEAAGLEAAATAFGKLSPSKAASAARPGTGALLLEAAIEWRRQKRVSDASSQARKLLLAEIENEVDSASAGTANAIAAAATAAKAAEQAAEQGAATDTDAATGEKNKGKADKKGSGKGAAAAGGGGALQLARPRHGAVGASPPANLSSLLTIGLAGYDVPATMSDGEVLVEYLQLLSLEQTSLSTATKQWLMASIVDYRQGLADALAANASANATAANATSANATAANATAATATAGKGAAPPPLLTSMDRSLPVFALVGEATPYPLSRARSTLGAAEDFAVVMAAVLQAYAVHARLAVFCTLPPAASAGAAGAAAQALEEEERLALAPPPLAAADEGDGEEGGGDASAQGGGAGEGAVAVAVASLPSCRLASELASEGCRGVADAARSALRPPSKCRTRVEVRLGKSAKKVAGWVATHRKTLRAQGRKDIKGAKTLHYATDADGYVWLPLTYHPLTGAEQVPGGAYPENATLTIHYPLPLPGGGGSGPKGGGDAPPAFSLGSETVDSRGQRLPSGVGGISSVLSTM